MKITSFERQAYEWSINQEFQSVAARNARALAQLIKRELFSNPSQAPEIQKIRDLINPYRSEGVTRPDLEQAYKLLTRLQEELQGSAPGAPIPDDHEDLFCADHKIPLTLTDYPDGSRYECLECKREDGEALGLR